MKSIYQKQGSIEEHEEKFLFIIYEFHTKKKNCLFNFTELFKICGHRYFQNRI